MQSRLRLLKDIPSRRLLKLVYSSGPLVSHIRFAFLVFNNQVTVSKALQLSGTELGNFTLTVKQSAPNSHALDGSSRGGRGGRGRSTNQGGGRGELSRGRGRDSWGPGAPYKSSASIESKAKKKTFEDAD